MPSLAYIFIPKLILYRPLKFRFLGTGTSNGVPLLGCACEVCRSSDPRDRRTRSAALVETDCTRLLIDCGPEIRLQLLPLEFRKIDGVLLTHEHYDHVGGLDDLRPYCRFGDIDLYANAATVQAVHHNFPYCFVEHLYPGVPRFQLHTIAARQPLRIGDIDIVPFEVIHGRVPILGYRFGTMAYITDMKTIAPTELPLLQGIDTLVVNALRWEEPHHSHLILPEAIDFARQVGARRTYFTHLGHRARLHAHTCQRLPEGMALAYDGLTIDV